MIVRIADVDFGLLRDRRAIFGIALQKAIDLEHLSGNGRRRLHRFEIFDGRALIEMWNMEFGKGDYIFGARPGAHVHRGKGEQGSQHEENAQTFRSF